MLTRFKSLALAAGVFSLLLASTSSAQLVSQLGILDLTANNGINPNTGVAWAEGDQYRLAFYTFDEIDALSNDPAVYDGFATTQAAQNPALAGVNFTAMVWVNTDVGLPQAVDFNAIQPGESQISNPADRGGYADTTGGNGIGGAGVPVYAMNGTTAIARNNDDILNNWSNPFDGDTTLRLAQGTFNLNSDGELVEAAQNVNYSPYLDQFGLGDTATVHGEDTWTGGLRNPVNPLGDNVDGNDSQMRSRASWGSSNANNGGRTWNRFQSNVDATQSVYAISELLTVSMDTGGDILAGDFNEDDVVDLADYTIWRNNLGEPAGTLPNDDSGLVIGEDQYNAWVDNFGATASLGATVAAVPEPSSIVLLASIAGLGLWRFRGRR